MVAAEARLSANEQSHRTERRPAARRARVAAAPARGTWPVMVAPSDAQVLALQFQFNTTQWWTPEKLLAHQLRQAQVLIRHAARTAPFWKTRLAALRNLSPGKLSMTRLRAIPPLTRADIQDAGAGLFSTAVPPAHGRPFVVRSSGSTGTPIVVRGTMLTQKMVSAFSMRGHLWHKRDLAAKNVDIRTASAPGRKPKNRRWSPVPGTGPSVRIDIALPIAEIFERVLAEDPVYLQTHPYTLLGLIERSRETGTKPESLREARTFGEALEPRIRAAAGDAWGVPVVDNYSAMEIGTIAHQCPENENLHVMAEGVLVEVLDDDGKPCEPGSVGRVVLTSLHNFAAPLIRYAIGDYARVGGRCACGRGLPVLERVMGRQRNLLVLPSGERRFAERHLADFTAAPYRQFQITQTALETIEVTLVVPRPWTAADEAALRNHLTRNYRHPFDFTIAYVDDIPRAPNGKYEEFASLVAD